MSHRVLVIDDDDDLRETLCEILRDAGFDAVGAGNGEQALELLERETPPCAILLDLMMPVMDGWAFRREQLRRPRHKAIPVVVLSAVADAPTVELQAYEFVRKPFRLEKVVQSVRRICPAA